VPDSLAPGPFEVFRAFLKLGCVAFGGPIAHLGYFREEFVARRRWLDDGAFADLVALCQFLPGPTSSQVAFALGWRRAGRLGGCAAWLGFTAPAAVLMLGFALGLKAGPHTARAGWLQGLEVAAVAVVAQAVRTMAARLCPDAPRIAIAAGALVALLWVHGPWMQLAVLVWGALVGGVFGARLRLGAGAEERWRSDAFAGGDSRAAGTAWLAVFVLLLIGAPWLAAVWPASPLRVFAAFYRSGALVFGGGHVVLPLLEQATVARGWLSHDVFLSGYGLAQALPGPLFAFAAYLGVMIPPGGIGNGLWALVAIYLPSLLLLFGIMPFWGRIRAEPGARAPMAGAAAAVVGLLAAAFYSPIATSAITDGRRLALAFAAYGALQFWRVPPWLVVLACAGVGAGMLG